VNATPDPAPPQPPDRRSIRRLATDGMIRAAAVLTALE